jgi:hypothetical protein
VTTAPNRLECCRPFLAYCGPPQFYRWQHSAFCPKSPHAVLDIVELDIAVPVPAKYPDAEQERHQEQAIRDLDSDGCPVHNGYKPWRDCPGCAAEVQAFKERAL